MKKLFVLSILFSVFLLTSTYADLNAEIEVIDNSIYLDEEAKFSLTIINPDMTSKVVQVYTPSVEWYVNLDPFITNVNKNSSTDLELSVVPTVWAETGPQKVTVIIDSPNKEEEVTLEIPIFVKSFDTEKKEYQPSVELKVEFPEEIDPRQKIPINIYFRNRNRLNITEMELTVESEIFADYKILSLDPLSERREKISFEIDPLTKPMDDKLEIKITYKNRTVNNERIDYKVIRYTSFVQKIDTIEELFKKSSEHIIINEGNVAKIDAFRIPTSFIAKFFTKTDPKPSRVNLKGQAYFEWDLDLEPYEEITIIVEENYRTIIYIILLSVVVAMIYFLYRSPVIIKKESIVIGSSEEGVSEMKVLLHVRNRSQDLIENITVTDLIPSIAKHVKESHVGTLAPTKILRHVKKGTIIKWEMEALEPFEERIITYKLKSKIAIIGGFTLPPAKVKFETEKGRERVVRSGRSLVSLGL